MVRILAALISLVILSPSVWAADVTLSWDVSAGATEYRLSMSTDVGGTWTQVAVLPASACDSTAARCETTLAIAESGYVLLRVAAANANGETIRYDAGVWHCGDCVPPDPVRNQGVQ